jgi:V-type H+-transporting ATPase subunit E
MISFVMEEAKEKAKEIESKTEHEYNSAKSKQLHLAKEKLNTEFDKKWKQLAVKQRIERSATINSARMEAMKVRNDLITGLLEDAKFAINDRFIQDKAAYRTLLKELIIQGLIKLLDSRVVIRCRQMDLSLVQQVLPEARSTYVELMRSETGRNYEVEVTLDTAEFLPGPPQHDSYEASCSGGVMLSSHEGKIRCINTLDERLRLVFAEGIPALRQLAFS